MESLDKALSLKLKTNLSKKGCLKLKALKPTAQQVNAKAEYIAGKFNGCGSENYLPFFRKVVWHLPEQQIDDILERSPTIFYFISVCKREMSALK